MHCIYTSLKIIAFFKFCRFYTLLCEVNDQSNNQTNIKYSVLFQTAPFAMLKRNSESLAGNSKYEGFCIDLIQKVCRILDVNCQIQPVKDGGYGARKPDGTWSGMIGELVRKVQCSLTATHTHTHTHTHRSTLTMR